MLVYRSGVNESPQVLNFDTSFFGFSNYDQILCSKNSLVVIGPNQTSTTAGTTQTTNDVMIINPDLLDNPF